MATLHALSRQAARATRDGVLSDFAALEDRHQAFHRALIAACGSTWLLDFSDTLYVGSERYRYPAILSGAADRSRDISAEHAAIADAALARNATQAMSLLSRHYEQTGKFIESTIQNSAGGEIDGLTGGL